MDESKSSRPNKLVDYHPGVSTLCGQRTRKPTYSGVIQGMPWSCSQSDSSEGRLCAEEGDPLENLVRELGHRERGQRFDVETSDDRVQKLNMKLCICEPTPSRADVGGAAAVTVAAQRLSLALDNVSFCST